MLKILEWLKEKLKLRLLVISDLQKEDEREVLHKNSEATFFVPQSGLMSALLTVFPLQRIAFDLTIAMGQDPDRPRNLAKTITT